MFLFNFRDSCELEIVNRRLKNGLLLPVSCPTLVGHYNKYIGYVDKADMIKSTYQINRESRKWWHRIFWHLVDTVNAYVSYVENNNNLRLKHFKLAIVDELGKTLPKKGRKNEPKIVILTNPKCQLKEGGLHQRICLSKIPKKSEGAVSIAVLKIRREKLFGVAHYAKYHFACLQRRIVL